MTVAVDESLERKMPLPFSGSQVAAALTERSDALKEVSEEVARTLLSAK